MIFIEGILYIIIISFAKFSVLCLYRRIFGVYLLRSITLLIIAQTMWMVGLCFGLLFRCIPISDSWALDPFARCHDEAILVYAGEALNCTIDLVMIALPVHVVATMQLSRRRKVMISGIFLLGLL